MLSRHLTCVVFAALAIACAMHTDRAQGAGEAPPQPPTIREIFVPFEDLNIVLENQARRVFISREEYQALQSKAKKTTERKAPLETALVSADYHATIADGRASMTGTLSLDVLADGLFAVELDLAAAGLRSATLDDKAASIGRDAAGKPILFVEGRGRHTLVLDLVTPLAANAAQQTLSFQVPTPPVTRLSLTVPGNVEVKSGAQVIERTLDNEANATRLRLLPSRGATAITMSLNNKQLQKQRVVVARSVVVDEVAEAYERLHVTVSLGILHGSTDQFRFVVPADFEITTVATPLLARWEVKEVEKQRVLDVRLRESTTETVVLNVAALRVGPPPENWTLAKLQPLDVAGQVAVVGLLLERRLEAQQIKATGLIPIDTPVLTSALPQSVLKGDGSLTALRPIVAYYAPQADFALTATFDKPPVRLRATTNLLLVLNEKQQTIRGGFALLPVAEKLFEFDFSAPAGWQIVAVTQKDGASLPYDRYEDEDGSARIHVRLPQGIAAGQATSVYFQAVSTPEGWLGEWKSKQLAFPRFAVLHADRDLGAVAVRAEDDLAATADKLQELTPLDEKEKAKYGLAGVATNLAYRYETPDYAATLAIERTVPRLTAKTYAFLRIEPALLVAHYEIAFDITEARTSRLQFALPKDTPDELAIRGLGDVALKESSSMVEADERIWTVLLADARGGVVRLAVDFQQPQPEQGDRTITLPLARAAGVVYQSGLVAVEGSAELDVQLKKHPRKVDVGELVDAEYQPGRRLLGTFGYVGEKSDVSAQVFRHPGYQLPAAIVERAELVTLVSQAGESQSAARFLMRTKALFLEVNLPAGSKLWSAYLDGAPILPQHEQQSLLLSLPAAAEATLRDLQLVYETPVGSLGLSGSVDLPAPQLLLRASQTGGGEELPVADLIWHLHLPSGYRVVRSAGTVFPSEARVDASPTSSVGKALYLLAGGVNRSGFAPLSARHDSMIATASKSGEAKSADSYYVKDDVEYFAPGAEFDLSKSSGEKAQAGDAATDMAFSDAPVAANELKTDTRSLDELADVQPGQPDFRKAFRAPASRDARDSTERTARMALPQVTAAGSGIATARSEPAKAPLAVVGGAPAQPPVAAPKEVSGTIQKPQYWALQGVRSLKIDLQQSEPGVTFQSLGADPRLAVTVASSRRLDWLSVGVALAIALWGVALTNRPTREKVRLVVVVLLVCAILPLIMLWNEEASRAFDLAALVACLLAPYYLLVGMVRYLLHKLPGQRVAQPGTVSAVMLLLFFGTAALGQPPHAYADAPAEPPKPVVVPADAILIPFDSDRPGVAQQADKLLVPYDKYVELWNLAYPDKKIEIKKAPAPFALAGAKFEATLSGTDALLITGNIDVDVYAEGVVEVPLAIEGGVLAEATLDGKPARLRLPQVAPAADGKAPAAPNPPDAPNQAAAPAAPNAAPGKPAGDFMVLYVSGKGRQRLQLALRFRLERQGGWRVATGRLPSATATTLNLRVPTKQTELSYAGAVEFNTLETKGDNELVATSPAADGRFRIQWRPKIAEAKVDQALTANSMAVVDVQEDGLRVVWQLALEFRRSQRETFSLRVPNGYLVERVIGPNIRTWQLKPGDGFQSLEVTLLKAAHDREQMTVQFSRRGAAGQGELAEFDVPAISVADAALHHGEVTIRRSPALQLRTLATEEANRSDSAAGEVQQIADSEPSPLGIAPYQSFRFATGAFKIRLAASAVPVGATAIVQSVLKIAERERSLESRIRLRASGRPIYRVRLRIPTDLKLEQVIAPEPFEWTATKPEDVKEGQQRELTIYLSGGQQQEFSVVLRGTLGEHESAREVAAPRLEVMDVVNQEGDIVVQADPALSVSAEELKNCESVLLARVHDWLQAAQRPLARLAIHYRTSDYSFLVQLSARRPSVTCYTVTNVRFTGRSIAETILLDFAIRDAGIREITFLLPASMKDSRITAPMLRHKTVEPVAAAAGAPVRVRLELQDEVMDQLRVLVENDRLLTSATYSAPIPTVETAPADRRYVALETGGRDEVVVDSHAGLDLLSQQQAEWVTLAAALPGRISQAYLVRPGEKEPALVMHTKDREAVETAGARIGLAQTVLVVDGSGAYRASQTYMVDNSTEQFLELELPDGAELWTAHVATGPVKPTKVPLDQTGRRVRVPLVKTAAGDGDFAVVLKYGGQLGSLRSLGQLHFPIIRTLNVNVELSQVKLRLPESHAWFDFGGTMRRVDDSADLEAGYLNYQTRQLEKLGSTLNDSNQYARVRATNQLKQLQRELSERHGNYRFAEEFKSNKSLATELANNDRVLEQVQQQLNQQQAQPAEGVVEDNRGRLNDVYQGQAVARSKNVVNSLGNNFDAGITVQSDSSGKPVSQGKFDAKWLEQYNLQTADDAVKQTKEGKPIAEPPMGQAPSQNQPQAPQSQVENGRDSKPEYETKTRARRSGEGEQREQLRRYEQRVQQQQAEQLFDRQSVSNFGVASGAMKGQGQGGGGYGGTNKAEDLGGGKGVELKRQLSGLEAGKSEPSMDGQKSGDGGPSVEVGLQQPNAANPFPNFTAELAAPNVPPAGALVSLDVEIPTRGIEFNFTTPRGNAEITARTVSTPLLARLKNLAITLVAIAVVLIVYRTIRRGGLAAVGGRPMLVVLLVVGLASLLSGIFPIAGVIAVGAGVVLLVRSVTVSRRTTGLAA